MYINFDKVMEKVRRHKRELAENYNVPESAVIWRGNNNYIVVKDGQEIRI